MRPLRQVRPRLLGRNAKVIRVTAVNTDQLLSCPKCDEPMRLSDGQTFVCKRCGRSVDVGGILKAMDGGE
jgi:tRNA(Ile2) C34 agmatinyltransferase TiaS